MALEAARLSNSHLLGPRNEDLNDADSDDSSDEDEEYVGKRVQKRSPTDGPSGEALTAASVQEAIKSVISNMGRRISGAFLPSAMQSGMVHPYHTNPPIS